MILLLLLFVFSCYLIVVSLCGHFILFFKFFFLSVFIGYFLVGWLDWLFAAWAFSSCSEQGLLPRGAHASQCGSVSCGAQALGGALVDVTHGLSCPTACGIFLDKGLNPHRLHGQADSQPLDYQGSPNT